MRVEGIILLFTFLVQSLSSLAKDSKYILPDLPAAQQREYIDNLLEEAKTKIDNHDYQSAQSLLTQRCDLLDQFYEKQGTTGSALNNTGYEYIAIAPKLYCNLRLGHVEDNLREISHVREQYRKLFNLLPPQNDLLETDVAETYFRMGNIGMAIQTAEKLISRLREAGAHSSVAYHKMYYRLMAYYESIGRTGTPYFENYYKPLTEVNDTWESYGYLDDRNMTFSEKMTNLLMIIAENISKGNDKEAREGIELGLELLDEEFPLSVRNADAEKERGYNLLKVQLMNLKLKSYDYFLFSNPEIENCLLDTYKLNKDLFGEGSLGSVEVLKALGEYYYDAEDDVEKALEYYQKAYNILKTTDVSTKGVKIAIMGAMMGCYEELDNPQMAINLAKELISATKDIIVSNFAVSSSAERAALWDKYNHWLLTDIPKLALNYADTEDLGGELYDIALFSKGLLMISDNAMTDLVMKKGSPELKQDGKKLHNLRLRLHEQLTSSQLNDMLKVDDTRREIEELEHSLIAEVNKLGIWQNDLNLGWKDIQKQLKKGEIAIEFIEASPTLWEEGAIIALILTPDSPSPVMRKMCDTDDLIYSETFYHCRTTEFYEDYWLNLEPAIPNSTTAIYFSPAGVLNVIPIEYCLINSGSSLFDRYEMYRLTSTRKIVDRNKQKNISCAYLYGGIDYTPDLNELKNANVALMKEGIIEEGTSGLTKDMTFNTLLYHSNGIVNQQGWMNIYTQTLASTSLLNDFLNMMGCEVNSFTNYRATEECFKNMSRKPIDALIINTHGFTFSSINTDGNCYSFTYKNKLNKVSKSEMAMTLSGLLLSGASMSYSPNCDREGLEDGVITAAEIAQLNLQNVELVHLSACETGLGEITPEGVLGIQRGFKRAGVKSIINTLAPSYTSIITYFDTTFYRNLFYNKDGKKRKKQSIHDAFYSSVRKVREIYKDPRYWCVNVLVDALD